MRCSAIFLTLGIPALVLAQEVAVSNPGDGGTSGGATPRVGLTGANGAPLPENNVASGAQFMQQMFLSMDAVSSSMQAMQTMNPYASASIAVGVSSSMRAMASSFQAVATATKGMNGMAGPMQSSLVELSLSMQMLMTASNNMMGQMKTAMATNPALASMVSSVAAGPTLQTAPANPAAAPTGGLGRIGTGNVVATQPATVANNAATPTTTTPPINNQQRPNAAGHVSPPFVFRLVSQALAYLIYA